MEDEIYQDKTNTASFLEAPTSHENIEYQKNLNAHESLVCQINIIYQREFDLSHYHSSLKLFLKWSSMFQ